jgi:hypothetical protein
MSETIQLDDILAMKQKVFIAKPTGEFSRFPDFHDNLDRVICPPCTIKDSVKGIYIANNQNELARLFLKSDAEYFWLTNDDQLYPPETLLRLLAHDKDVCGVNSLLKGQPHPPLIYSEGEGAGFYPYRYFRHGERGLVRVGAVAGGGMLIRRHVFEKIADPWWEVHTVYPTDGRKPTQSSEDFDFCKKVTDAGFEIWCDLDIRVPHGTTFWLMPEMTATGEWITTLMRGDEKLVVPAAPDPKAPPEEPFRDLYRELAVYLREDLELVEARANSAGVEIAWQWRNWHRAPVEFYRSTDLYLFDLTHYQTMLHRSGWHRAFSDTLREMQPATLLDFGGGIGETTISAWKAGVPHIDYTDVRGSRTRAYAEHRFLTREIPQRNLRAHGEDFRFGSPYDVIVAMDVLEHLENPGPVIQQMANSSQYLISNADEIPYGPLNPQHISKPNLGMYFEKVKGNLWRRR